MSNEEEEFELLTIKDVLLLGGELAAITLGVIFWNEIGEQLSKSKGPLRDKKYEPFTENETTFWFKIDISSSASYSVTVTERDGIIKSKETDKAKKKLLSFFNSPEIKEILLRYSNNTEPYMIVLNRLRVIFNSRIEHIQRHAKRVLDKEKEIEDREKQIKKVEAKKGNTIKKPRRFAIGIHAASQFYNSQKVLSLFSEDKIDSFYNATGLPIIAKPNSYGVVLNQSQRKVFEGIINAFSETNYKGDYQVDKYDSLKEIGDYKGKDLGIAGRKLLDETYSNIEKIPVIRVTQAELISLSGYDLSKQRQGDKQDVIGALNFLATNQFCFYWVRGVFDEKGKPILDKKGKYLKEDVMEVGTLFRVKYVQDENTNEIKYYEIHPSSVVLDQVNKNYGGNYFLSIPSNWREEVEEIAGKRASKYTFEFLFWLRIQFEIRRSKKRGVIPSYIITKSWEDIAKELKMPESMYIKNRVRTEKIIRSCYEIAIELGYLIKVEDNVVNDKLYLNESYYPKPGELRSKAKS